MLQGASGLERAGAFAGRGMWAPVLCAALIGATAARGEPGPATTSSTTPSLAPTLTATATEPFARTSTATTSSVSARPLAAPARTPPPTLLPSPSSPPLVRPAVRAAPPRVDRRLGLDEVIAAALEETRDVLRARADVLLVDVDKLRAYAAVLPQVGLSFGAQEIFGGRPWIESRFVCYDPPACVSVRPGGDYEVSFGPFFDAQANAFSHPQLSLGLNARQLVFDGGRWWTTIARNDELRARETATLRTVREAARLLAIRRFYDLVKAQEGVRFAVLQLGLSEAQLARAKERVVRGEGASDELAIAERNLATDRLSLAQRRFNASNLARFVNLAMGHAPEERLEVVLPGVVDTATVPALVLPPEDELLALALDARPELESTRAALRVVEKNITIRGADHWPQIALQGAYSRTSRRPDRVFSDPTEGYNASAGVTLSWPLSTGGAITASVREAELELEKGRASYEDLVRVVKAEVLEKRERLELLLQSYRLQDQSVRAAERARSLTQARYERGESNQLELRDAELRLTQALLARIEQRLEVEVGIAELERALGAEVPRLEAARPRR